MPEPQPPTPFDDDAAAVLGLAELEARRAGAAELEVRHIALALAQHPSCRRAFQELGIGLDRLRAALAEGGHPAGAALRQAQETAQLLARARNLLGGGETAVGGHHLLMALLQAGGAAAQAIARESGVPLNDLAHKPELMGLPPRLGRAEAFLQRLALGARRIGRWTVRAFAWSALWAFVLYLLAAWVLGSERGPRWFPWLLLLTGAGCALGLVAQRAWRKVQRRRKLRAPFAPRKPA